MYDIWLSYLATRMQLYEDLERMPLDSRGVWIDEARSLSPAVASEVGYVPAAIESSPITASPPRAAPMRRRCRPLRPGSTPSRSKTGKRHRRGLLLAGVAIPVVALVSFFTLWKTGLVFGKHAFTGPTWTVRKEKLKVSIVERGSLESAKNSDIICTVRLGKQGSLELDDDQVDSSMRAIRSQERRASSSKLDDSGLQETLKQQNINVDTAKALWVQAEEDYRIQEIQNVSDTALAENNYDLAKIDLQKYIEGDYIQSLKDVEGRIEKARYDL